MSELNGHSVFFLTTIAQNPFHYCLLVHAVKASPDPGAGGRWNPLHQERVSECVAFFHLLPNTGVLPGFAAVWDIGTASANAPKPVLSGPRHLVTPFAANPYNFRTAGSVAHRGTIR